MSGETVTVVWCGPEPDVCGSWEGTWETMPDDLLETFATTPEATNERVRAGRSSMSAVEGLQTYLTRS